MPIRVSAVRVEYLATGDSYDLDQSEITWFWDELRRVTLHRPERGLHETVAADCRIDVQTNRGALVYELYGQTILYDPSRDLNWQFYMGMQLLDWVEPPVP